jgi:hypothetical protein
MSQRINILETALASVTTLRRHAMLLALLAGCPHRPNSDFHEVLAMSAQAPVLDGWDDYLRCRDSLPIDALVAEPRAEGVSAAADGLGRIVDMLDSGALAVGPEGCYRQQEAADFASGAAQRLLYANRKLEDAGAEERVYRLSILLGKSNFASDCAGHVVGGVAYTGLTEPWDASGHDPARDAALIRDYSVIIGRLDAEAKEGQHAALRPRVVDDLEAMAGIAREPALSCEHADTIRAKANFVAANVLTLYDQNKVDLPRETVRLGKVIAATEASYICGAEVSIR